jgi:O-antigen/teichoic acid export membrane protein
MALWHLVISTILGIANTALVARHFGEFGATPAPYSTVEYVVYLSTSIVLLPARFLAHLIGYDFDSIAAAVPLVLLNSLFFGLVVFILYGSILSLYGTKEKHA